MKRDFVLLLLIIWSGSPVLAQDIITLKSGVELKSCILRLNANDIAFFHENSKDTTYILRDSVLKLNYLNGVIVYLSHNEKIQFNNEPYTDSLYSLGSKDALMNYKGYKAAATGTLVTSFFIPWGLLPAITCSATPPSMENLGYRNQKLMENQSYYNGYTNQAHRIKKQKVWTNFAVGTGVSLGLYILLLASLSSIAY